MQLVLYPRNKKPRQFPSGAFYHPTYAATLAGMTISNSSSKLHTWPVSFAAIAPWAALCPACGSDPNVASASSSWVMVARNHTLLAKPCGS